jgi:purine-cytosine permease-like protein
MDIHSYLASLIPLAIIGATRFYTVLVAILGRSHVNTTRSYVFTYHPSPKSDTIGYWTTIFAAIVLTEHFLFRKNNFDSYQIQDWDKPSKLPIGIAAILSFLGGFGMVIPSMSQLWYTGPIAKSGTGDIGVLTGTLAGAILYAILRALEKKVFLGR